RDFHVTGVQTCALPICRQHVSHDRRRRQRDKPGGDRPWAERLGKQPADRSKRREEAEGAEAGDLRARPLALEPHEQAQPQRRRQRLKRVQEIHAGRLTSRPPERAKVGARVKVAGYRSERERSKKSWHIAFLAIASVSSATMLARAVP